MNLFTRFFKSKKQSFYVVRVFKHSLVCEDCISSCEMLIKSKKSDMYKALFKIAKNHFISSSSFDLIKVERHFVRFDRELTFLCNEGRIYSKSEAKTLVSFVYAHVGEEILAKYYLNCIPLDFDKFNSTSLNILKETSKETNT